MSLWGDIKRGAGKTAKRIGQAAGLVEPDDLIDEEALYAPTERRIEELYGRALGQADAAATWGGPASIRDVQQIYAPQVAAMGAAARDVAGTVRTEGVAHTAGPVERYQATLAAMPRDVVVDAVDPNVRASEIGPAERAIFGQVGREQVAASADALRDAQLGAIGLLQQADSSAQKQFEAAMTGVARQQLGVAAQARGSERAGARREAMLAIGQGGIEAADRASALAAQETLAKRQAAVQALAGLRAADQATAFRNAEMAQAASNLEAQIRSALAQGNAAQANALRQRQAELGLQAELASAGNRLAAAQMRADVAAGNIGRGVQVDLTNTGRITEASAAGAAAANMRAESEAARRTAVEQQNLERGAGVAVGDANRSLEAAKFTAGQQNVVGMDNAARAQAAAAETARLRLQRDQAQSGNELAAQQVRQAGQQAGMAAAGAATATGENVASGKMRAAQVQQESSQQANERLARTATSTAMLAASDIRAKEDVSGVSYKDLRELADAMRPIIFRYKRGIEDGGERRRAGVIAQDLERSKLGKALVSEDEDGLKRVDYQGLAAMLAAAAAKSLHRRRDDRR